MEMSIPKIAKTAGDIYSSMMGLNTKDSLNMAPFPGRGFITREIKLYVKEFGREAI